MSKFIEGSQIAFADVRILKDDSSLERRVEAMDGTVLCECDGTSRAIRGCLSGLLALEKEKSDCGETERSPHMRFVRACMNRGNREIEKKF